MTFISQDILKDRREYFIDKVKRPLTKAIIILGNRYPEPTYENIQHPNSKVWLRIIEKFLAMEDNPGRMPLFQASKKIFIGQHEHDHSYYGVRIDIILELWLDEVLEGHYKPRSLDYPNECWKIDPNQRTLGYEFLKTMYYNSEKREALKCQLRLLDKCSTVNGAGQILK